MSKSVINKSHMFDVQDAIDHSIEKAVILYHLKFWLEHNRANNTNFHEGHWWTYNSAEAFATLLPYLTRSKIARMLRELEKDGVILVGNYNKKGYDRTKWYSMPCYSSLFKSEQCNVQNQTMQCSNLDNAMFKNEQPIPDVNTDGKPVGKPDKNIGSKEKKTASDNKAVSDKKAKFDPLSFLTPSFIDKDTWKAYHDMRAAKKKPATEYACKLLIKKLTAWHEKGLDINAAIEKSIVSDWTDIFEPKTNQIATIQNKEVKDGQYQQSANQHNSATGQQLSTIQAEVQRLKAARNGQSGNAIRTVY